LKFINPFSVGIIFIFPLSFFYLRFNKLYKIYILFTHVAPITLIYLILTPSNCAGVVESVSLVALLPTLKITIFPLPVTAAAVVASDTCNLKGFGA